MNDEIFTSVANVSCFIKVVYAVLFTSPFVISDSTSLASSIAEIKGSIFGPSSETKNPLMLPILCSMFFKKLFLFFLTMSKIILLTGLGTFLDFFSFFPLIKKRKLGALPIKTGCSFLTRFFLLTGLGFKSSRSTARAATESSCSRSFRNGLFCVRDVVDVIVFRFASFFIFLT